MYFSLAHTGTLNASEMGLGKTVTTICTINADPSIKRILIVCPASMRIAWRRELEKWLVEPVSIGIIGVDKEPVGALCERNVVIVNYDRLHTIAEWITSTVFDLAVLDECHLIKTPASRRSRIATSINSTRRLALSGTPLQNKPVELRPVLSWLSPAEWPRKEWHAYGHRYCGSFWDGFTWNENGASNLDELATRLRSTVMYRRTKSEVLPELPSKFRSVIELSSEGDVAALVSAELDAFIKVEASHFGSYAQDAKALRTDYTQINWDDLSRIRHQVALAKVPLVITFIKEALGGGSRKVVVFAYHRDVVAELVKGLGAYNPVSLVGGDSPANRQTAVDTFQNDPEVRVFVGNIQAAGTGITLTAASHAVFAECSWVPAEMTQAEGRLHRIGTRDSVLVHHLVLAGSLDSVMVRRLIAKQAVLDEVLEKRV